MAQGTRIRKWAGRCQSSLNSHQYYLHYYYHNWHQRHHDHKPSIQPPWSIQSVPGVHEVLTYTISSDPYCASLWGWRIFQMRKWGRETKQLVCPRLNSKYERDAKGGIQACLLQNPTLRVHATQPCFSTLRGPLAEPAGRNVQALPQLWLNFYLCCCRRRNKLPELSVYLWGRS